MRKAGAHVDAVDEYGNSMLHLAVQEKARRIVASLLDKGANVNVPNADGDTPLHLAVREIEVCLDTVELLLRKGADLKAVNKRGWTPLHCAAQEPRGPTELVTLLLERGADVEATDSDGNSPLHLAAKVGALSKVELLLKNGADFEAVNKDYFTALHFAGKFARHEIAELLLTGGANTNAISVNGNSPLQLQGHNFTDERSAEKLLKKGAKVDVRDKDGRTPLHWVAHWGNVETANTVYLLLQNGAAINAVDNSGCTPLHFAAQHVWSRDNLFPRYGDVKTASLVNLLSQNGAAVNAIDNSGSKPLHIAAQHVRSNIVEELLDNGAHINAADGMGNTALHFACGAYHATDMVKMLLSRGALVDAVNNHGLTPMVNAAQRKMGFHCFFDENIHLLLDNGANNLDAVNEEGNTMLHFAVKHKHHECNGNLCKGLGKEFFKVLLDRKVRVNIFNNRGDSPLNLANDDSVIKELLNLGADINLQDCFKNSALHRAVTNKKETKAVLLLNNGIDSNLKCSSGQTALELAVSQRSQPWRKDSNELVCKCLMRHVISLKVAGLYVCPEDLSLVESEYDDMARRFEQRCKDEVERLKSVRLGRDTFLNILTDHHNPKYARNEPIVQQLLSKSFEEVPIYGCHIVRLLKKSRSRLGLVASGQNSLKLLLRVRNLFSETKMPTLPIEILEEIVSYLDDKDLQNLHRCREELVRK